MILTDVISRSAAEKVKQIRKALENVCIEKLVK